MGSMYVASDAAMMGRMLLFTYLGRQRVKEDVRIRFSLCHGLTSMLLLISLSVHSNDRGSGNGEGGEGDEGEEV